MKIKAEAASSMQLLRAMLPAHVIRQLKAGQTYISQHHEEVTVGFAGGPAGAWGVRVRGPGTLGAGQ